MFLNSALSAALDRIAERAADVRRAYTPGAIPAHDDVATPAASSDFTLDPLAVVASEGSYFITSDDGGHRLYTRDGALALRDGRLVDSAGRPIFGRAPNGDALVELRVDPVDEAVGRVRNAAIERDGTFVYDREAIDPRTGTRASQRVVAGRIALARFPAGSRLEASDGAHCTAPAGVAPTTGFAADGAFGPLQPLRRERSRVNIDESLVRLKEAYLAFDALQAAEAAKAHLGKTAMDLLK
jgi:flagellar basal body rod protein FlgG